MAQVTSLTETPDFKLTYWKGFHNWQCKHCPYATINGLGAMLAHLSKHDLTRAVDQQKPENGREHES